MIAKNPITVNTEPPAATDEMVRLLKLHHGGNHNAIDLSSATAELPPNELPGLTMLVDAEAVIRTEQRARIKRLEEQLARSEAKVERSEDPLAERFEVPKNAEMDTGIPRQTLERWAAAIPPLVKHFHDENGQLWIDCIDANRQRFALAPIDGH